MGVYIEEASMPKNCEECNFKVVCKPYWKRVREQYTRPTWCPCKLLTMQSSMVGEWITYEPEEIGYGTIYECPYCKYEVEFEPTNYCPNCGAKMKGADDE